MTMADRVVGYKTSVYTKQHEVRPIHRVTDPTRIHNEDGVDSIIRHLNTNNVAKNIPKGVASNCMSNLIREVATPKKTNMLLVTKAGVGTPMVADGSHMSQNWSKPNTGNSFPVDVN